MRKKILIIALIAAAIFAVMGCGIVFLFKDNAEKEKPRAVFVKGEEYGTKLF